MNGSDRLLSMRVDALFGTSIVSGCMGLAGALLAALVCWSEANAPVLSGWIAAAACVLGLRVAALLARRRGVPSSWTPRHWAAAGTLTTAVSGLAWGSAGGWLLSHGTETQALFVSSLALGAIMMTISSAVYWPAHLAFHAPVLLLAAAGFALTGRFEGYVLAAACVSTCFALAFVGRGIGRALVRAMELSLANRQLADALAERSRQLEEANRELLELSATDPLTGLANRRKLMSALRARRPGALMIVDVDHFKSYNDSFGHAGGDDCLRLVAATLAGNVRPDVDLVARHGGEEFAVLLGEADMASTAETAERLRAAVERLDETAAVKRRITVSIGYAMLGGAAGVSLDLAMAEADAALYRAKRGGRNRVCAGDGAVPAALRSSG